MTAKRNLRIASSVGPATREQLDQWAGQHDRTWDRIARAGVVIFGLGLFGLAVLSTTEAIQAFKGARSSWSTSNPVSSGLWRLGLLGVIVALACVLAIACLWWHFVVWRDFRPVNPYRSIEIPLSKLEKTHAAHPGALAYLDAIRHQGRPIAQHDVDVLEMIRRQPRSSQGG